MKTKSTQSRPAFAVLSVREIRNLLAIAERSAALNTDTPVENTVVVLRGEVSVGKRGEKSHVRLDAAGYYGGDFTLWSQTPVAS